jgi:hypothetical protein
MDYTLYGSNTCVYTLHLGQGMVFVAVLGIRSIEFVERAAQEAVVTRQHWIWHDLEHSSCASTRFTWMR